MRKIKIGKFRLHLHTPALNMKFSVKKLSAIMPPVDDSSTRGGSTSVRGRVRSPHTCGQRWLSCRQPCAHSQGQGQLRA